MQAGVVAQLVERTDGRAGWTVGCHAHRSIARSIDYREQCCNMRDQHSPLSDELPGPFFLASQSKCRTRLFVFVMQR